MSESEPYDLFYSFVVLSETTEDTFKKIYIQVFQEDIHSEVITEKQGEKKSRANYSQHKEKATYKDVTEHHELAPLICEHFLKRGKHQVSPEGCVCSI